MTWAPYLKLASRVHAATSVPTSRLPGCFSQNDRALVLEEFWRTRQTLELPEQARPKSAPVPCSAKTPQAEQAHGIKSSGRKVGVLKCLEGVLRGATLEALDGVVSVPVLLITSTGDALDTSGTAEVSKQAGGCTCRVTDIPLREL